MVELKTYNIIKEMKHPNGRVQKVLIVDNMSEILEISNSNEANNLAELLKNNSDSGHNYYVREIK